MSDRYKISFKIEVINYYDRNRDDLTKEQICEEKSISLSTLNNWLEERGSIFNEKRVLSQTLNEFDGIFAEFKAMNNRVNQLLKIIKELV